MAISPCPIISAEIGSGRIAVFDDGRSNAGAGTVTLEALLERGMQIVFAGCHSRRLLKGSNVRSKSLRIRGQF
jgi:hypothetical protein